MRHPHKRTITAFIIAYIIASILQSLFPTFSSPAMDETTLEEVNLVSLLVDTKLYNDNNLRDRIDWYATSYIQGHNPNTKVIITPIDTKKIKARDIVTMLENMYFEGLQNQASHLDGVILVGDIPFPVVKENDYIFPSIFPYVDFEEQRYIRDKASQYFVYNDNPNSTPEIWHSVINVGDSPTDYINYFDKLQQYKKNPDSWVSTMAWYDDFVYLKQTFSPEMFGYYLLKLLFAEDVSYHRFTNGFLSLLQQKGNDANIQLIQDYITATADGTQTDKPLGDYDQAGSSYQAGAFIKFLQKILGEREKANAEANKILADAGEKTSNDTNKAPEVTTPTLLLSKSIHEIFKDYTDVVGMKYLQTMRDNLTAGGRWTGFDSHVDKMVHQDSLFVGDQSIKTNPLLMQYNQYLQQALDKKIEDEQWYMHLPILTKFQEIQRKTDSKKILGIPKRRCETSQNNVFENYYFGTKADQIDSAEQLSIYRGSFVNATTKDQVNNFDYIGYKTGFTHHTGTEQIQDIVNKSIGSSYGVFSNQVEANRGYDNTKAKADLDLYENNKQRVWTTIECPDDGYFKIIGIKIFCQTKKGKLGYDGKKKKRNKERNKEMETPEDFAKRLRGGASLINLGAGGRLKSFDYHLAQSPLFDIVGSKALTGDTLADGEKPANSYGAYKQYASLIQTKDRYGTKRYNKKLLYKKVKGLTHREKEREVTYDTFTKNYRFYQKTGAYNFDYFSNYKDTSDKGITTTIFLNDQKVKQRAGPKAGGKCNSQKQHEQLFSYKTIDSRVRNTSMTEKEFGTTQTNLFKPGSLFYNYFQELNTILQDEKKELTNIFDGLITNTSNVIHKGYTLLTNGSNTVNNAIRPQMSQILGWTQEAVDSFSQLSAFMGNLPGYVSNIGITMDDTETSLNTIQQTVLQTKQDTSVIQQDLALTDNTLVGLLGTDIATLASNKDNTINNLNDNHIITTAKDLQDIQLQLTKLQQQKSDIDTYTNIIKELHQKILYNDTFVEAIQNIHTGGKNIIQQASALELFMDTLIEKDPEVLSGLEAQYNYLTDTLNFANAVGTIEKYAKSSVLEYTGVVLLQDRQQSMQNTLSTIKQRYFAIQQQITQQEYLYNQYTPLRKTLIDNLFVTVSMINKAVTLSNKVYINTTDRTFMDIAIPVVKQTMRDYLERAQYALTQKSVTITQDYDKLIQYLQQSDKKLTDTHDRSPQIISLLREFDSQYDCNTGDNQPFCQTLSGYYIHLQERYNLLAPKLTQTIRLASGYTQTLHDIQKDLSFNIKYLTDATKVTDLFDQDARGIQNLVDMFHDDLAKIQTVLQRIYEKSTTVKTIVEQRQYLHTRDPSTNKRTLVADTNGEYMNIFPLITDAIGNNTSRLDDYTTVKQYLDDVTTISASEVQKKVNGLGITTPDRPIDSIQNITFQGLGGDLVQITFPNLYEIPVFTGAGGNKQTLLTKKQIEQQIITYLQHRVEEYNTLLDQQNNKKNNRFTQHQDAFVKLKQVDNLASPAGRSIDLLDKNYLVHILTKTDPNAISTIADILSTQNSMWQQKIYGENVKSDIQRLQDTADVNHKIANIMQLYLNEKSKTTHAPLALPAYNMSGYEIAYINSDGHDYIDIGTLPTFIKNIQKAQNTFATNKPKKPTKLTDEIKDNNKKCYVPPSGAFLFYLGEKPEGQLNRFEAFSCRLQEMKKDPLNIKFSYRDAQGPVIPIIGNSGFFDEESKSLRKKHIFENPKNQYTKSLTRYKDAWLMNIWSYKLQKVQKKIDKQTAILNNLESPNSTIIDTIAKLKKEKESIQKKLNKITGTNKPATTPSNFILATIKANLEIILNKRTIIVDETYDTSSQPTITFTPTNPLSGAIDIYLDSTGDTYATFPVKKYTIQPKTMQPLTVPITRANNKAGTLFITADICLAGAKRNQDNCYTKEMYLDVLPGQATSFSIHSPTQSLIPGQEIPLVVKGYDTYHNPVSQTTQNFIISVDQGTINGTTGVEFSSFPYDVTYTAPSFTGKKIPDELPVTITVKEKTYKNQGTEAGTVHQAIAHLTIYKPTIIIQPGHISKETRMNYSSDHITTIQHQLPETRDIYEYTDKKDIVQMRENGYPSITVHITDHTKKKTLSGIPFTVTTSNHLVTPGIRKSIIARSPNPSYTGKYKQFVFQSQQLFLTSSGDDQSSSTRIYLHHTMQAGQDTITVTFPDGSQQHIPLTILPAKARVIIINSTQDITQAKPNQKINTTISLQDVRKNPISNPTNISIGTIGSLHLSGQQQQQTLQIIGSTGIQTTTDSYGGKGFAFAYNPDFKLSNQQVGLIKTFVQQDNIPWTGFNAMYATIAGTDRGNLRGYFSDNKKKIPMMITNSSKLLAVTTQLIDPNKLHTFDVMLSEDGTITNTNDKPIYLQITNDNKVQMVVNHQAVTIGQANNSTIDCQWNNTNEALIKKTCLLPSSTTSLGTTINLQGKQITGKGLSLTFAQGSTNGKQAIGRYTTTNTDGGNTTSFSKQGYKSLEDTTNPDLHIGFRHTSQHLTNFAAGQTVGEATKQAESAFSINFGDPYVQRITPNKQIPNTHFTADPGQIIYTDPHERIAQTLYGDINGDGLQDMLVIYQNGKVKWLKNYGGKNAFTNMQDLLYIADNIKKAYLGDVDGNGFPDLLLHLQNDTFKVYKNNKAIFTVDGYPICLQLPTDGQGNDGRGPMSVKMTRQIFIKDMDNDGNIDIVTNDEDGDLKIHYGGNFTGTDTLASGAFYVSNSLTGCDRQWKQRQQQDVNIVKNFLLSVDPHQKVVDESLIRRKGVDKQAEDAEYDNFDDIDLSQTFPDNTNTLPAEINADNADTIDVSSFLPNFEHFPTTQFVNRGQDLYLRWKSDPNTEYLPSYDTLPLDQVRYHPLTYLNPNKDIIRAYKYYEDLNGGKLRRGDTVKVTVTIQGKANVPITYIDKIVGPRQSNHTSDDITRINLNPEAEIIPLDTEHPYNMIVDNIILASNTDTAQFSYNLVYQGGSMVDITLDDTNRDTYTDIKVYPRDGCDGIYYNFINTVQSPVDQKPNRIYATMMVDTNEYMKNTVKDLQKNYTDYLDDVMSKLKDSITNGSLSNIPGFANISESYNLNSLFSEFANNNMQVSQTFSTDGIVDAGLGALGTSTTEVEKKMNKMLDGMCKGFKIGKGETCGGPPIPFNMSFLSPGNYQIFGCKLPPIIPGVIGNDNGFPIFAYPATLTTPIGPLPLPFPRGGFQKVPGVDTYGYFGFPTAVPPGVYPSLVRIYLSPTLTMGLGAAFCFGPQLPMNTIPSPLRDIAGNCIVFSLPYSNSCEENASKNPTQVINNDLMNNSKLSCPGPKIIPGHQSVNQYNDIASSAISMTLAQYTSQAIETAKDIKNYTPANNQSNPYNQNPLKDGQAYGPRGIGIVRFDMEPLPPEKFYTTDTNKKADLHTTDNVQLVSASKVKTAIRGGMQKAKGLFGCIINGRVERQITYIINNLTNMTIGVYLPDPASLFQGFENINIDAFTQNFQHEQNENLKNITRNATGNGTRAGNLTAKIRNSRFSIQQAQLDNLSATISNPFDAMQRMFADVPLISFETKDININVPMLYAEDVTKYAGYLQTWLDINIKTLQQRKIGVGGIIGFCNSSYTIAEREEIMQKIAQADFKNQPTAKMKQAFTKLQKNAKNSLKLKKDMFIINLHIIQLKQLLFPTNLGENPLNNKKKIFDTLTTITNKITEIQQTLENNKDIEKYVKKSFEKVEKTKQEVETSIQKYLEKPQNTPKIKEKVKTKKKIVALSSAIDGIDTLMESLKNGSSSININLSFLSTVTNLLGNSEPTSEADKTLAQGEQKLTQTLTTITNAISKTHNPQDIINNLSIAKKALEKQKKETEKVFEKLAKETGEKDVTDQIDKLIQQTNTNTDKLTIDNACLDLLLGGGFVKSLTKSFMTELKKVGVKAMLKILGTLNIGALLDSSEIFDLFFNFSTNLELLINRVKANLKALGKYKTFPLQLYEWIHVTDRYMSELTNSVSSFVNDFSQRFEVNATRFTQYTDSIITLIGIIRTRQAIIDLPVNWQTKCSTCTNDNYNFYGCGFGFICDLITLPILPIPPFKIPSIYMDFSHIDANISITLPNFNFRPTSIPLPQLPDLPSPPKALLSVDINSQKDITITLIKNITLSLSAAFDGKLEERMKGLLEKIFDVNKTAEFMANIEAFKKRITGKLKSITDLIQNIDLTNIPVIPTPPELPPLPSFIPTIEMKLPTLPPAPKIPNLIPDIELILDVADIIGKIYCITKGNIGLVAEKGVKSKIEQITQRTWKVPRFDDIDFTPIGYDKDVLKGFDRKVDAFVTFNYSFGAIYDILDTLAQQANDATNKAILDPINSSINQANQRINKNIQNPLDTLEQNINIDPNELLKKSIDNRGTGNTSFVEQKQRLIQGIQHIITKNPNTSSNKKFTDIISRLDTDAKVSPNYDKLQQIHDIAQDIIHTKQIHTKQLAQRIRDDRDGFLDSLPHTDITLANAQKSQKTSLDMALFTGKKTFTDTLKTQESPMNSYLTIQQHILKGFANDLKKKTPAELGLTTTKYQKLGKEMAYISGGIQRLQQAGSGQAPIRDFLTIQKKQTSVLPKTTQKANNGAFCKQTDTSSDHTANNTSSVLSKQSAYQPSKKLGVQVAGNISSTTTTSSTTSSTLRNMDLGQYIEGIFVKANNNDDLISVVSSPYHIHKTKHQTTLKNLNDNNDDLLLYNEDTISIKYADNNTVIPDTTMAFYRKKYVLPTWNDPNYFVNKTQHTDGYWRITTDTKLKVASPHREVKNFRTIGQSYDSIRFGRKNARSQNDNISGYIVRLTKRADLFDTQKQLYNFEYFSQADAPVKYILVLPIGQGTGGNIEVARELVHKKITDYMTGTIVKYEQYDPNADNISIALTNMPRNRRYAEVATLKNQGSAHIPEYVKQSMRSNQIVAGQQLIADDKPPVPQIELYRKTTDKVIDEGTNMQGYINTHYDIRIHRQDESAIANNWMINNDKQIVHTGSDFILSDQFFPDLSTLKFTIGARDVEGNEAVQQVQVKFIIPQIDITEIQKIPDDQGNDQRANIIAEIDHDLDEGSIQFQKKQHNQRVPLQGNRGSTRVQQYQIRTNDTISTGGLFEMGTMIDLYLPDQTKLGTFDGIYGKLKIYPGLRDRIITNVNLQSKTPVIRITDKQAGQQLFSLFIPSKELKNITLHTSTRGKQPINEPKMKELNGGTCITDPQGTCALYVSPKGNIYVASPYNQQLLADYQFNESDKTITYTIKTQTNQQIVSINFVAKPFVQRK